MSTQAIADKVVRQIERTIAEQIPMDTCPEKKPKIEWQREQVRQAVIDKLTTTKQPGPSLLK